MPSPRRSSRLKAEFDSDWATAGEIAAAVAKGRVSAVSGAIGSPCTVGSTTIAAPAAAVPVPPGAARPTV